MPLYCTAIGKALLAHSNRELIERVLTGPLIRRTPHTVVAPGLRRGQLDRILEAGVAFEYEESSLGIACVAAPILARDDTPLAAVSLTGPVTRFNPRSHVRSVRATAAAVSSIWARSG